MIISRKHGQRATTLIETTIAAAISATFLGSLFALNLSSMDTIKMARESACASQVLQQRVESLRIANWHQVTDANWLTTNLLNTDASGASQLNNVSETLTITPYGSTNVGSTQLTRSGDSVRIVSNNSALLTENAVKIVWSVDYKGVPNDRSNSRQTVAILAKGGVAKW